jgi:hypothetical protein
MAFRNTFSVETPTGPRWDLALELLQDGKPIVYANVEVTIMVNEAVVAAVESDWSDPANVDRASATRDLDRAERVVASLSQESPAFRDLVQPLPLRLELLNNYGMGAVTVATRSNGATSWSSRRAR